MGAVPDARLAAEAGVTADEVAWYREQQGIAPFSSETGKHKGLGGFKSWLGKVADEVIATQAGVSAAAVATFRRQLGIDAYPGHAAPEASSARKAPGRRPAAAGATPRVKPAGKRAAKPRVEPPAVEPPAVEPPAVEPPAVEPPAVHLGDGDGGRTRFNRSKLEAWSHQMGRFSDAEVARQAGASLGGVRAYRERHGIPAFGAEQDAALAGAGGVAGVVKRKRGRPRKIRPEEAASAPPAPALLAVPGPARSAAPAGRVARPRAAVAAASAEQGSTEHLDGRRGSKLDAFRPMIGVLWDSAVAKLAGMSAESVRLYRKKHGIEAGKLAAVPSENAAPSTTTALTRKAAATRSGSARQPVAAIPAAVEVAASRDRAPAAAVERGASRPADPAAAQSRGAGSPARAFRVRAVSSGDPKAFIVVGRDVGAAAVAALAMLADRADGPWSVQSLRDVGEVLG